jgi:hypothetical protein
MGSPHTILVVDEDETAAPSWPTTWPPMAIT